MENYSEYNKRNIFELFTPKRVLFLSIDALDFKGEPRLKVRCCNLSDANTNGTRITGEVSSYIPLGEFLVLSHDVLTGVIAKRKKLLETQGAANKYTTYYEHFGGAKWPEPISTKLSLVGGLGKESEFALLATSTWGAITSTGGIIPASQDELAARQANSSFQPQSIFINMPNQKLKEFCLIGKTYAEQFINLDLQDRLTSIRKQRQAYAEKQESDRIQADGYGG